MLTLNLVSLEQKKEIKIRRIYSLVKNLNLILIVVTITIAIILLVAKMILQSKSNDIISQITLNIGGSTSIYNKKVKEINNKIHFIEKIQNEFIPWSNLFKSLADITPADISFNYIKINSQDRTIKIKGRADYRSSLLNFKDKMSATSYFEDIEFPIKNILEKENVDFEINAKLNLSNITTAL